MEYKGYIGKFERDDEMGVLYGEIIGIRDVITFEGTTVEEAQNAFRESVDDYLDFCIQRGDIGALRGKLEWDGDLKAQRITRIEPK